MTDAAMVEQVLRGNREAYTGLIDRYRNVVYGIAYYHLQNFDDARDVAQETFIRAYVRLGRLREPEKFGPWLRRVAVNECRMWRRRERVTTPLELSPSHRMESCLRAAAMMRP